MRRAAKKDANHNDIAKVFERCGFSVFDSSALPEFVDMVVYRPINGVVLVEVKDGSKPPSATELTKAQEKLAKKFPVAVVYREEDVLALANGAATDPDL